MARDGRRLSLLDGARWEGEPLPGDRAGALLCALATAWPHGLSDEALAAEVWPDEDYELVHSHVPSEVPEDDLFAGVTAQVGH